jgi:hypothetical protein
MEPLESRALLVGFYDGPASVPIQISLRGTASGIAVIQPAGALPGQDLTLKVAALGRITPLGVTTVTGRLHLAGENRYGTIWLETAKGSATLSVSGPAAQVSYPPPATTALAFDLNGRTVVPNTLFSYVPEIGIGTVGLTIEPRRSNRPGLILTFEPPSGG